MTPTNDQIAATSHPLDDYRRRLFNLLNDIPGIVYLRTPDYNIDFANRRFRERFGDPDSKLCYKLIHNRTAPCEPCGCAMALAEGQLLESEWVFADGASFQLYDYPFVDVDGVEKVLHLGIDITKRKEAEAELERANRELLALSQIEHRERMLAEGLAQAALALNSSLDPDQVLDRILEQTLRVVSCAAAIVLLVEDDVVWLARQRGFEPGPSAEMERLRTGVVLESIPYLQAACRGRQPILIEDVRHEELHTLLLSGLEWVRSLVLLPMIRGDRVVGCIVLLSDRAGVFTHEGILRLGSFASHAALTIENVRLYQEMKESREQLQSLSRRLVEVQENERRTVAHELHDEAGQALTSLVIQLKLLQGSATDPDQVRAGTAKLIGEVETVMENLHRVAMALRPVSLDRLGLVAALHQHCETLADQHGLRVTFGTIGIEGRVAPEIETALYRIVQEALNNVVRHAHATRADVLLKGRGDHMMLIIEDDGRGFESGTAAGPNHLGLVSIQERAMAIGGSLTVESSLGRGTALFVEVPNGHQDPDCG